MRTFTVRAKPMAREDLVQEVDDVEYVIATTEPPVHDRANRAILKLLADHLGVSVLRLSIISGRRSKLKRVSLT